MLEIVYAANIIVGVVKDNRFTRRADFQMEFCSFLVS
jgi:hypothetical protein